MNLPGLGERRATRDLGTRADLDQDVETTVPQLAGRHTDECGTEQRDACPAAGVTVGDRYRGGAAHSAMNPRDEDATSSRYRSVEDRDSWYRRPRNRPQRERPCVGGVDLDDRDDRRCSVPRLSDQLRRGDPLIERE